MSGGDAGTTKEGSYEIVAGQGVEDEVDILEVNTEDTLVVNIVTGLSTYANKALLRYYKLD